MTSDVAGAVSDPIGLVIPRRVATVTTGGTATIATPEEVAERLWSRIKANLRVIDGQPSILNNVMDDILDAIAAERSSSQAEIDRLTRDFAEGVEIDRRATQALADTEAELAASEAKVASLTETVGKLREALGYALDTLQAFLDTFGDLGDRVTQADIEDWRAALSPTEPAKET